MKLWDAWIQYFGKTKRNVYIYIYIHNKRPLDAEDTSTTEIIVLRGYVF